ncbi:AAA family ATPase [Clostridium perfringens]
MNKKEYRLLIKNLCKLSNIDIEFDKITTISGYNNVGKSTILKVLYVILKAYNEVNNFTKDKNINEINFKQLLSLFSSEFDLPLEVVKNFEIKELKKVIINFKFLKVIESYLKGIFNIKEECENLEIELFHENELIISIVKNNTQTKSFVNLNKKINLDVTYISNTELLNYSSYIISAMSSNISGLGSPGSVPDYDKDLINKLASENRNIDKFNLDLNSFINNQDCQENIRYDMLKYYIKYMENSNLNEEENGKYIIFDSTGIAKIKDEDIYVDPSLLGHGLKLSRIIKTLEQNKYLNKDSFLLIDEPENGLHTRVVKALIKYITSLECNTIITTHNVQVLTQYKDIKSNHIYVQNNGSRTKGKNVPLSTAISKLSEPIIGRFKFNE